MVSGLSESIVEHTGAVIIKICEIVVLNISYMLLACVIKAQVEGFYVPQIHFCKNQMIFVAVESELHSQMGTCLPI